MPNKSILRILPYLALSGSGFLDIVPKIKLPTPQYSGQSPEARQAAIEAANEKRKKKAERRIKAYWDNGKKRA